VRNEGIQSIVYRVDVFSSQVGGVAGLAVAFRTSLTGGILEDELSSEQGLTQRRQRYLIIAFACVMFSLSKRSH
jgi:hypothetical protein